MDVVTCIAGKIGELLVEPIGRQIGHFIHYRSNTVKLQEQVKILEGVRDDLQVSVDAAKRNGEVIRKEVQNWTSMVDGILSEANKLLEKASKVRFHNLATRYQLSRKAQEKTMEIEKQKNEGKFDRVSNPAPPPPLLFPSQEDIVIFESRERQVEEIMEALKDNKTNFIGIYGMGGVGKTTLVKQVVKRAQQDRLFPTIAMVVVSQTIEVKKIQDQIAERLGLKLDEANEQNRVSRLLARLKEENKVLIILDDIWARLDLATVGIPLGRDHASCKIIVTTRRKQVCDAMVDTRSETAKVIPINILSEKESWVLLKKNAGAEIESLTLNSFAKDILRECGGLPIALVTVGRAMRGRDPDEWQEAVRELRKSQPETIEGMDEDVYRCLQFSYTYLKDKKAKKVFNLCCLFPEDFNIRIEDLVRYGFGLKIFEDMRMEDARRSAHSIIKNLKDSCLLLGSDEEGCVKMHDVVRDVALSMASDYFVRDGVKKLEDWPDMEEMKRYTGISIMQNQVAQFPDVWDSPNLKILLMDIEKTDLVHLEEAMDMPATVLTGMKALQVFHRRDSSRKSYRAQSFRFLKIDFSQLSNLRTLMLQYYKIDTTPIGELKMLEILSLKNCQFRKPFNTIGKLTNLRLLDVEFSSLDGDSSSIFPIDAMSTLSRLEELYFLSFDMLRPPQFPFFLSFDMYPFFLFPRNFPSFDDLNITVLKTLSRLTTLTIHIQTIPEGFMFPELKVFKIRWGSRRRLRVKEKLINAFLSQVEGFNYLGLCGEFGGGSNITISSLVCMKPLMPRTNFLYLDSLEELKNINPCLLLGGLDALKILVIVNCPSFAYLMNAEEVLGRYALLPELEGLCFEDLDTFKALCNGELPSGTSLSMRKLKYLTFFRCPELLNIFTLPNPQQEFEQLQVVEEKGMKNISKGPTELLHLPKLQIVCINGCQKLKVIFPASIARGLEQLKELELEDCDQLEAVIAEREEEEKRIDKVVFSQLISIRLYKLYNLKAFCMDNLPLKWPTLEELSVDSCPKMKTFAASDGNQITPKLKEIKINTNYIEFDGTNLNTIMKYHNKEEIQAMNN
ncbi:probable disease resistance protein At5g63020 isoform X2 [Manihot esculenta]|nr:probable disease resistance protein At5g63020 isoform X2 [Manihot esculenta]XP_043807958.1 probable disease resistance protein At5g63020 isoform X2 [Manihot esculenta]XP_043807959.1 probable disease resistance protein At5g63020 isoform X2 [Manihot esculenta]